MIRHSIQAIALLLAASCGLTDTACAQISASAAGDAHAASNIPGQFDYYLLDLVWGPSFCSTVKDVSPGCRPPRGFAVHGLWPQNTDNTWPQFCSKLPHGVDLHNSRDITPDLTLLQHEWDKHGTCSGLTGAGYFAAAHTARTRVNIPETLLTATPNRTFTPLYLLNMFYLVNPGMPPGSLSLSCREDHLMSVEACFSKTLEPVRCMGLRSCEANIVRLETAPVP